MESTHPNRQEKAGTLLYRSPRTLRKGGQQLKTMQSFRAAKPAEVCLWNVWWNLIGNSIWNLKSPMGKIWWNFGGGLFYLQGKHGKFRREFRGKFRSKFRRKFQEFRFNFATFFGNFVQQKGGANNPAWWPNRSTPPYRARGHRNTNRTYVFQVSQGIALDTPPDLPYRSSSCPLEGIALCGGIAEIVSPIAV